MSPEQARLSPEQLREARERHSRDRQQQSRCIEGLPDASPEQFGPLPQPITGRFVVDPDPERPRLCLAWQRSDGLWVIHPVSIDGLLVLRGRQEATWLPEDWTMETYPAGWDPCHIEAWFKHAIYIMRESRNPRDLVDHAHLILCHLQLPNSPSAPRETMDRGGCGAYLREVQAFLRITMGNRQPAQEFPPSLGKRPEENPDDQTLPKSWLGEDWDELAPLIRRLLRYMHGKERANLNHLCPIVWERDYDRVKNSSIHNAIYRANKYLEKRERRVIEKIRQEPFLRWR